MADKRIKKIREVRDLAAKLAFLCDNAEIHSLEWWIYYRETLNRLADRKHE